MPKPNCFIIGAPKCGTTSLSAWLSKHPGVCFSLVKEPHFFSTDVDVGYRFDERAYYSLFRNATEATPAVLEGSTKYLFSHDAVPRIERELPGGKYIVMLRNPVTMVQSLHWQWYRSGYIEDIIDFREAWEAQEERCNGKRIPRLCRVPGSLQYRDLCLLGEQLQRLYDVVPRERVMVILLEDMKRDPRGIWLKIQSFLGIPDDGRTEFPVVNAARTARSRWQKKLKWCFVFAWLDLVKFLNLGTPGLWLYSKYQQLIWNKQAKPKKQKGSTDNRPSVSPEMKQELIDSFREDISLLGKLLDRDLSHWLEP